MNIREKKIREKIRAELMKGRITQKDMMLKVKALAVQEFGSDIGIIYEDGIIVIDSSVKKDFDAKSSGIYSARQNENGDIYFEEELTAKKMKQVENLRRKFEKEIDEG